MKRISGLVLAALLALGNVSPANAQDAYMPEDLPMEGDSVMFSISEQGTGGLQSTVLAADKPGNGPGKGSWNCESIDDPECSSRKADQLWGATVFGVCETQEQVNCIEEFSIGLPGEELQSGTFTERPAGIQTPAKPSVGYPGGGTGTLWSAPHAPSESGSTDYLVSLRVGGGIELKKRGSKWEFNEIEVNVIPYRLIEGDRYQTPSAVGSGREEEDGTRGYGIAGFALECAWNDAGRCGRAQNFVPGTQVKVAVRVSKDIGGWFKGRMKAPNVSITSHDANHNRIAVLAQTVTIQKMAYFTPKEELTAKEKEFFNQSNGGMKYGTGSWWPAAYRGIFDYISYFKDKVNDTAAGTNEVWNFGSVQSGRGSQCLSGSDRVLGIVTTNALGFDGASPAYSRGSLNYNVGGLHFNPGGEEEFLGSYDLVMRSDVARCLYGFNKAPVSATITVSGEGDRNIATTLVGEKGGWLKLAAYGFTFSNKTIKVKLTQKKQTTITCVAPGKKSKKVTAAKPKCPKGFKKK
jgi:hypothetical protein